MITYTKDGVPINRSGDDLFDASGEQVARLEEDKAFGPDGTYIATLLNDRLIFFANYDGHVGSRFKPRTVTGFSVVSVTGITTCGDEPKFAR